MSATLEKTIIKVKDMDTIFAEVPFKEGLSLSKPGQLRLFHLRILDGEFYHADLEKWLYLNLSRYVFSRARMEKFRQDEEIESAINQAIITMKENGAIDEKGMGTELGEMLIYAFLEGKLSAPKLMSRVELSTEFSQFKSRCESIHFLLKNKNNGIPFNQMVFGTSSIVGDMKEAIDNAFNAICRIKKNSVKEIQMVSKQAFYLSGNPNEIEFLSNMILPKPNAESNYHTSYGIFLGYSIGITEAEYQDNDFEDVVNKKMLLDIQQHTEYIVEKVKNNKLTSHSFYIYVLPFMDAVTHKKEIMEHIVLQGVSL